MLSSYQAPTLSFADDEEACDDFKIKKSKASRMIKKMRQAPNVLSSIIDHADAQEAATGNSISNYFFCNQQYCLAITPILRNPENLEKNSRVASNQHRYFINEFDYLIPNYLLPSSCGLFLFLFQCLQCGKFSIAQTAAAIFSQTNRGTILE